ncbi:Eco57I restriction-modification methylase domain-containing protein [Streptomyces umbrinus]|uniref:Eco57I restriction-modification methylase domain-containing protein n=1 Tax=Streptomyces umbrinus TaxID=67370 RepID=UPI001675ABC4|nr:Eco57I restriction-modification methylase domain-containing protein [Streptomyces umbrinus]
MVSDVVKWCRGRNLTPLPETAVPGTNERERSILAALGGVSEALAQRAEIGLSRKNMPGEVQDWLCSAPAPPTDLIERLLGALKEAAYDPLALIYERIVASPRRRRLGTFFTPEPVLDYMKAILDLRLAEAPRTVADPGAGVGAFTTSALSWWPRSAVHAIDVNLVTLGLLATRPGFHQVGERGKLHVRQEDFLGWLGEKWPRLRGPRLIMGNPPYTRHQQLTQDQKKQAQAASGTISLGLRAGLSTYFLAASLTALRPRDSLCLLLPANWLEADYARAVRSHLWRTTRRKVELHLFPNHLEVFPGTQVAAMVIFVGPVSDEHQEMTLYRVAENGQSGFSGILQNQIQRESCPLPVAFTADALNPRIKKNRKQEATVPLAEIVHIRRGVATGANRFFLRTLDEKNQLPEGSCVRAVSRIRDLPGDVLSLAEHEKLGKDGLRCWLLKLDNSSAQIPEIRNLLNEGELEGVHERHLCKVRSPWYALERIIVPDLLIGPMGKSRFRVIVNDVGAIPTNTLYGLRLRNPSLSGSVNYLAQWLSGDEGQAALRTVARQHGDGLLKLEPGPLSAVPVPARVLELQRNAKMSTRLS